MEITLLESKDIKSIGVGESTQQPIQTYLDLIGLNDDSEWMKECDATYKAGIKFTDFREKGTVFHYPFGRVNRDVIQRGLDCWPIIRDHDPDNSPLHDFARFYCPMQNLIDYNKMSKNEDQSIPEFSYPKDLAYHFDSIKFGLYLKNKICIPLGVNHIIDEIGEISRKENGDIDVLTTQNGVQLSADLFIDCTGFKSLLLEETMGSKFISFNETLLNDKAIATKIQYDNIDLEMENVTNCTAIENGWVWNIPLWNRIGSGYVYSSKFVDRNQAEVEFRNHLKRNGKTIPEDAEILNIDIRHGKREKAWVGNVLGVGLSYGFIEPLESTGLLTSHENIVRLVSILKRRNRFVSGLDKSILNLHLGEILDGIRSFIEMHYALSMRDDTDYWRHVTGIEYDNDLDVKQIQINCLQYSNMNGIVGGLPFIMAGMNYLPTYKIGSGEPGTGTIAAEEVAQIMNIQREFQMFNDKMGAYVQQIQSHYQFLKENIYN